MGEGGFKIHGQKTRNIGLNDQKLEQSQIVTLEKLTSSRKLEHLFPIDICTHLIFSA